MNRQNGQFHGLRKTSLLGLCLALLIAAGGESRVQAQTSPLRTNAEKKTMTTESKFYCNTNALSPNERARHKQLTDKLVAARKDIVETETGYEFQFSPENVSVAELANWVAAEGKCCPFFDFHIDLEHEGNLLCLRLTGAEGIKAFIRVEFRVSAR